MIHRKLTASGAELEELSSEKEASNRGRGMGGGPGHPLKKFGLAKSRGMGRLAGREAVDEDCDIMGGLAYRERKGGSDKARKGISFTLRTLPPPWIAKKTPLGTKSRKTHGLF